MFDVICFFVLDFHVSLKDKITDSFVLRTRARCVSTVGSGQVWVGTLCIGTCTVPKASYLLSLFA